MRKVTKKKTAFKTIVKVFLTILFISVVALLRVHLYALINNLKYEIGEKEREEQKLLRERETFKKKLYLLKSPSRIEKEALRLGMSYPQNWQIKEIHVNE